jgi:hypothetical protein
VALLDGFGVEGGGRYVKDERFDCLWLAVAC